MSQQFKKSQIATLVGMALSASISANALAYEEASVAEDVEVIEVTGVRSSLTSALNAKKAADTISDSIIAEEIGKSSDENIAQALSRISGVSLDRDGGDNQTVTVRGIQAALNDVKLNGVSMTSNTDDQAVDLSLFSADVLSRIDVVKSPSANQEEGSLGAAINLQTRAPLSSKKNVNVFTVEARHNDLREDTTPRFAYTGIYNLNESMGFAGSLFYDEKNVRKEEFNIFNSNIRKFSTAGTAGTNGSKTVINADTLEVIPGDTWAVSPNFHLNRLNLDDKVKKGGTLTFQYRPNEDTDFRFDTSYSRQEIDHEQTHTRMHNMHRNPYEVMVELGDEDSSNRVVGIRSGHVGGLNQSGRWLNTTDTLVVGAQIEHAINDDWMVSGRVGYSASDQEFTDGFRMNWVPDIGGKQSDPDTWCGVDWENGPEGDSIPEFSFCNVYDGNDPTTMKLGQIRSDRRDVDDSKSSIYLDASRAFDNDYITSVEFGVKYTDRTKEVRNEEVFFGTSAFENENKIMASDIPGAADSSITGGEFLDGIAPAGTPTDWIFPDIDATVALAFPNGLSDDLFVPNPLKAWEVDEKTYGAYVQANFELLGGDITGNFGVRYANTEVEANGHSGIRFPQGVYFYDDIPDGTDTYKYPVHDEHDYDNWLPSVTVNWVIEDDLILRASAAKVMARPNINSVRSGFDIKANNTEEVPQGNEFNTALEPFEANQFDVSIEWYFQEGALLSAAAFYKDFTSFTYKTSTAQQVQNPLTNTCLVDRSVHETEAEKLAATTPCADVDIKQTVNGGSADIQGLELAYQQNYTFLPGLFSHLGSSINYTYADSEAIVNPDDASDPFNGLPFKNTSEHSSNVTVFWEDEKLSLRLAYAYRSEALSSTTNKDSSVIRDARGTLDFTANYAITKQLKVSFSALNLTNSYDKFYEVLTNPQGHEADGIVAEVGNDLSDTSDKRTHSVFDYGSDFRLSLRYSF
ncbi:TonB-dependent receptor [Thalassotalea fonticola]|uniref:TonB-dependent receptor n=1 Tax=Thalassotalea fonticola TaxID=3065649 RepID=A0ABZ0GJK3_9GAMM|nr:TonB-dependent receptor [Colwelliaceae bacterium S1-1]